MPESWGVDAIPTRLDCAPPTARSLIGGLASTNACYLSPGSSH